MNRIIKAHLNSFVESAGISETTEANQFEKFVNFSVIAPRVATTIDPEDVTTGEEDDGIDGVAIIIDEEAIFSEEDVETIFKTDKRNHDVELIFVQAKRSDSFDLGDFLKFKESVLKFVNSSDSDYNVSDNLQKKINSAFNKAITYVPKIRNGKPSIVIKFVACGIYQAPEALETAKREFNTQLGELGLFYDLDIKFVGRDELTALWVSTYSGTTAKLEMFSNAPLPSIAGIDEAYLAVVKAKDFVENVLTSPDGNLRAQVFEENVRSFLGLDNIVNGSISETVNSGESATRFPVLNNGITIVSPNVIVQGNILHLENFQIVNGCQTSNVLFENRKTLDDRIMVNLKVVETSNEDVFSELVRATNSQTKVDEAQFFSLRPIVKKVEQYFNTYEGQESRIYFERRDKQYVGREIPLIRIFPIDVAAKSVVAMFCQRPDLAFRYKKTMYDEFSEVIFNDNIKEAVYYAGCLTLYRLHLLVAKNNIPQNSRKYKWHILPLIRVLLSGKNSLQHLSSKKIEKECEKIIEVMSSHNDQVVELFKKSLEFINSIDNVTEDRLKRQAIFGEILEKVTV